MATMSVTHSSDDSSTDSGEDSGDDSETKASKRREKLNAKMALMPKPVEDPVFISNRRDPIILPAEIREKILSYLSGEDLIQLCLVSYEWDLFIRPSVAFRNNVQLNIHPWTDVNLITTHANTSNFNQICISKFNAGAEVSILESIEWKKAIIKINNFSSISEFINYVELIKDNVEDLKIINAHIEDAEDMKLIEFPNLKSLDLNHISLSAMQPFIAHHTKLESLSLKYLYESLMTNNTLSKDLINLTVIRMLTLNTGIKSLILSSDVSNEIFAHDISQETRFNLTHLILCSDCTRTQCDIMQENIFSFLVEQLKSLETLKMVFRHDCKVQPKYLPRLFESSKKAFDFEMIIKVWSFMEKLKKLSIRFMISRNIGTLKEGQALMINPNITELHLIFDVHINSKRYCYVYDIIKACPNLEKLRVRYLSNGFYEFLSTVMKKLKLIECYVYACGLNSVRRKLINDPRANNNIIVEGTERYIEDIGVRYRDFPINY